MCLVTLGFLWCDSEAGYFYSYQGTGSLLTTPAQYSGTFLFGISGTWLFVVDDSAWPPADSVQARWDYIWNNYFVYTAAPGAEGWIGTFDGSTLPSTPVFTFNLTGPDVGTLGGNITFDLLVRDDSPTDGIPQEVERDQIQMDALLIINPVYGTGDFVNICGSGSMGGTLNHNFPPGYDTISGMGQLSTNPCPAPVEKSTWGSIKAMYK
jgi:hypothetical protein